MMDRADLVVRAVLVTTTKARVGLVVPAGLAAA